jgi:hypothetical protein
VNVQELKSSGFDDDYIARKRNISQTDFGSWQSIPKGERDAEVRAFVKNMGLYMHKLSKVGPGMVCNNQNHDCASWAADSTQNFCSSNLDFMISKCSLACKFCHVIEDYHTCRSKNPNESLQAFDNIDGIKNRLITEKHASNLIEGSCSATDDEDDEEEDKNNKNEWVLSVDWEALWQQDSSASDPNTSQRMELLKYLKSHTGWVKGNDKDKNDNALIEFDGSSPPDRNGDVLVLDPQQLSSSSSVIEQFYTDVAELLGLPNTNLLQIEFERYEYAERYASHKEYRLHDSWKHSGHRILSSYIVLEHPTEGGSFGFPGLDWLIVSKPQILIWPNLDENTKPLSRMDNEQLPVIEGTLYAARVWVRQYPFYSNNPCA